MSDKSQTNQPYEILGALLRKLREGKSESVADVSGAVEMEESIIESYETGQMRPSEDILLLLMNHFGIQDDKAEELWDIAGYERKKSREEDGFDSVPEFEQKAHQTMMVMLDPRVMYTDGIEVFATKEGVVVNFHQRTGVPGQPLVVSRVGMSKDQAKTFMGLLHKVLYDMDNPSSPQLGDGNNKKS